VVPFDRHLPSGGFVQASPSVRTPFAASRHVAGALSAGNAPCRAAGERGDGGGRPVYNGSLDRMLYERKRLDESRPFKTLKDESRVNEIANRLARALGTTSGPDWSGIMTVLHRSRELLTRVMKLRLQRPDTRGDVNRDCDRRQASLIQVA
jgi:hypothetical protein